jgi:hypothetical protein
MSKPTKQMIKQETKQQAESLIEKHWKVNPISNFNYKNSTCEFTPNYGQAIQHTILEVQSKIDLLEECNKHLKEYGLEMLGKLDHQKEILKYLEEL